MNESPKRFLPAALPDVRLGDSLSASNPGGPSSGTHAQKHDPHPTGDGALIFLGDLGSIPGVALYKVVRRAV